MNYDPYMGRDGADCAWERGVMNYARTFSRDGEIEEWERSGQETVEAIIYVRA